MIPLTPIPFLSPPALLLVALSAAQHGPAEPGTVLAQTKISEVAGGFTGEIDPLDGFGRGIASLGDLDGDGTDDLAVGAPFDDDGGLNPGAVWILFLEPDGSVREHAKISLIEGGFPGPLEAGAQFGGALAPLGDLDGDSVPDLAVGAPGRNDGGPNRGVVWILFLEPDGSIASSQRISSTDGDFTGPLADGDQFGSSIANLGDLDGDGLPDLAVGAVGDAGGGTARGAVWLLYLGADGRVDAELKIGDGAGGFGGVLSDLDAFGSSVAGPGDVDGDGTDDLAVGAVGTDPAGGVWILLLDPDGTVREERLVADGTGEFMGDLEAGDGFGISLCAMGDISGDGVPDVAAGAYADDDGGSGKGAIWFVFLGADGNAASQQKVSATTGGFAGGLDPQDAFGYALAYLDDFDGDERPDVAATAYFDDDGGLDQGALHLLFLDAVLPPEVLPYGCGVNPERSLTVVSGEPAVGTQMSFALDNPFGTQAVGSATAVFASLAPDAAFPCGTLFPNWGMEAPGTDGELLVGLGPSDLAVVLAGPPWGGAGAPAIVQLKVPKNPALLGLSVFLQGVIADPTASQGIGPAWTAALELRIGP